MLEMLCAVEVLILTVLINKKNMTKYLLIAIGILAIACAFLWGRLEYERGEASRLMENQAALLDEVKFYQTERGKSAASVQALTLSKNELEKNFEEKCQLVEELGLKVKRLQSMSHTGTSSHIDVHTETRDSLIYEVRDSIVYVDTLKLFAWSDPPWVSVRGAIHDGNVDLDVQSRDTLVQIVHRVPKRFLFFRYGTKAIRQEVVSKNPHTRIVYSEYIELK